MTLFDETTVRETESASSSEQLGSTNGSHTPAADDQQSQISNSETTALKTETHETAAPETETATDRKSTRLNSSHLGISYAVFCLKKKKKASPVHTLDDTWTDHGAFQTENIYN